MLVPFTGERDRYPNERSRFPEQKVGPRLEAAKRSVVAERKRALREASVAGGVGKFVLKVVETIVIDAIIDKSRDMYEKAEDHLRKEYIRDSIIEMNRESYEHEKREKEVATG